MMPRTSDNFVARWPDPFGFNPPGTAPNRTTTLIGKTAAAIIGFGLVPGMFLSTPAYANLIQNGNFETGTFASWSTTGNVAIAKLPYFGEGSTAADGAYFVAFNSGDSTPSGVLSQTFTTVAGVQYALTYSYGSNGGQRQSATTALRDAQKTVLASQFVTQPTASGTLTPFGLTFTADTTSTTLSFTDYPGNATTSTDGFVDNVLVTAVPEPSSLLLLAIAVGLCASVRVRCRRADWCCTNPPKS